MYDDRCELDLLWRSFCKNTETLCCTPETYVCLLYSNKIEISTDKNPPHHTITAPQKSTTLPLYRELPVTFKFHLTASLLN